MKTKKLKIIGHNPANQIVIRLNVEMADRLMSHIFPMGELARDIAHIHNMWMPFYISIYQGKRISKFFRERNDFAENIEYYL